MNVKKFQKRKEDFICKKCGENVKGDGYTNHCPSCLWSKHVDIFPGDRLEPCQGLLEPIGAVGQGDKQTLIHRCVKCGYRIKNKVSPKDNFDEVVKISKKPVVDVKE